MHKVTKSRYKSYEIRESGFVKIFFSLWIVINMSFQLPAQWSQELIKLGGSGTVNPLVLESVSPDEILVAGSFRGSLEIQGVTANAAGGDDIFIALLKEGFIKWLISFGNADNDAMADKVWMDSDHSVSVFITFWDEINIGGEVIVNPGGGRSLVCVRLNTADGSVISSRLFPVRGAIDHVRISAVKDKCYVGAVLEGDLSAIQGELILEDFRGLIIGELDNKGDFRLIDTVRSVGKCVLSGMAVNEKSLLLGGFFNGRLVSESQVLETVSIYDNGFMIRVENSGDGELMKRFGGIFDNNFIGVEFFDGHWWVSGHFTGVMELGGGKMLETQSFNSDFVLLEADDNLEVLQSYQSEGLSVVRNFGMKRIGERFYLGNQYFKGYTLGEAAENCESVNIASDVVSFSDGNFISESNFCLSGNVNNPLYTHAKGDVFSFTTNADFELSGREYKIEGANDGFLYFAKSSLISIVESGEKGVHFYPNPSNGCVNIEVHEKTMIEIYNFQGMLLERKEMMAGASEVINFRSAGVYFIGVAGGRKEKLVVTGF